jgi:hypothetical protein
MFVEATTRMCGSLLTNHPQPPLLAQLFPWDFPTLHPLTDFSIIESTVEPDLEPDSMTLSPSKLPTRKPPFANGSCKAKCPTKKSGNRCVFVRNVGSAQTRLHTYNPNFTWLSVILFTSSIELLIPHPASLSFSSIVRSLQLFLSSTRSLFSLHGHQRQLRSLPSMRRTITSPQPFSIPY